MLFKKIFTWEKTYFKKRILKTYFTWKKKDEFNMKESENSFYLRVWHIKLPTMSLVYNASGEITVLEAIGR